MKNETASNTMSDDNSGILLHNVQDGVATLTLNKPRQLNCLSEEMLAQLEKSLAKIGKNTSIRVVVIAGSGDAFCAGHDLKQMRANPQKSYYQDLFKTCSRFMITLTKIPQPVIARIHGIATAAGCQLVAACDLAIASSNATFATSGVSYGLFCSTPSVALSRNVSRKKAAEMLFTGEFIDANEAKSLGLVNRVVPLDKLDEEIKQLAISIIKKSPRAIAIGKKMFYKQIELDLDEAYKHAAETMAFNMMDKDAEEGIDAFIEKRKPSWNGGA